MTKYAFIRNSLLVFTLTFISHVTFGDSITTNSYDVFRLPEKFEQKSMEQINQCLLLHNIKPGAPLDTFGSSDPLEGFNRIMFEANQKIMVAMVRKVGTAYEMILPDFWRERISDVATNISMPARFINNMLQGKFSNAFKEVGRFLINVSLGIGGLFDSSTFFGIEAPPKEDFGQTLGHWGVGPGIYLVIPFLGNTNARDLVGFLAEIAMDPLYHLQAVMPGLRIFATYNELMVNDKGRRYLRVSEIVPDAYYEQKTIHDILRAALSCQ